MKLKGWASAGIVGLGLLAGGALPAVAAGGGEPLLQGQQVVFGGSVTVPEGETQRDAVAFGGDVTVDGTVTHDAVALGGSVVVNGTVERDVVAMGGNVTLGPHARVGHDISIFGGTLSRAEGSVVGGGVVTGDGRRGGWVFGPWSRPWNWVGGHGKFGLSHFWPLTPAFWLGGVVTAIGMVLLALLTLLFFPRHLQMTGTALEQRPIESFALGCGGFLAGLALSVLFAITILFIPVSFFILTVMTVAWLFGWGALFLVTGQRLLQAANRPQELVLALLLGGAVLGFLANVPVLGAFVIVIGGSVALGAAVLSRFGTRGPREPLFGPASPPPAPPATG